MHMVSESESVFVQIDKVWSSKIGCYERPYILTGYVKPSLFIAGT